MLKVQTRLASALATPLVVALSLALPATAFAQLADVTDAPFSFKNETNSHLTIELISVVKRNGQEVPYNITWTHKPGQYSWLMHNNQKISGAVCTFVVRTPSTPQAIPLPGEPPCEAVSVWNWHSRGTTEHGDVCIPFTNDWLKDHQKCRVHPTTPKFTPAIDSAKDRYREFLQQQITRVEAAVRTDEGVAAKQGWAAPIVRSVGGVAEPLLKVSPYETDRKAAPWVGPILDIVGTEVGNHVDRERAATEVRLNANRQLLQKYKSELNALPKAVPGI